MIYGSGTDFFITFPEAEERCLFLLGALLTGTMLVHITKMNSV